MWIQTRRRGQCLEIFLIPDWEHFGRAAGPIRNKKMAEYADAVILFPGGKGTASMLKEAQKAELTIYDYRGR